MATVSTSVKAWEQEYYSSDIKHPNPISVFDIEGVRHSVSGLLRHLHQADQAISRKLQAAADKLDENQRYSVGLDIEFIIRLEADEKRDGIEQISYTFIEQSHFVENARQSIQFPQLMSAYNSKIAMGLSYYRPASCSLRIQLNTYDQSKFSDDYDLNRLSQISIAGSNFRNALLMNCNIDSHDFTTRMRDIATVNGAKGASKGKFERAALLFPKPPER